jgi:DNA-binding NarL/FixJ family response regulator
MIRQWKKWAEMAENMGPLRILLVDDNPQDRHLVMRELRKAFPDAEIVEAINQSQLDEQISLASFELVITDYHLHWSDGIRVLQSVKRHMPHCPVIMFTATGSEEIAVEAMRQGLDDYIIKNVKHLVRLQGAVRASLEHARTRRRMDHALSRLESVLSQLQVGIFSCSPEGRFLDLNNAMVKLIECEFGWSVEQTTLPAMFSDDTRARTFLQEVLASREPSETEIEVATSPERTKVYRLNARLVTIDGEHPRIDGLIEDVSRRKRFEAQAKEAAVAAAQLAMLSVREKDVLREVLAGSANKVIAHRLEISEKTVEKHRSSIMKKLRVRSVAELVRLALLAQSAA